ncbi:hypothetical protein EDD15DRAFT_2191442 [Pisolithus albus]|nr:hypothetical protein EDD15DRAFT_2191442 [Pisolithus albus]
MNTLTFMNVGNEVIGTSFACEKFMSGTCGNRKDSWNVMFVGDGEVRSDPFDSLHTSSRTVEMVRGTHVINVVNNVIYIKVTGSLSKWDTHTFTVDIQSPSIKKVVLHLKDTVGTILPAERKHTLEEEALEQVEEASSKLQAAHAALWMAYEGTIGIHVDMFIKVTNVEPVKGKDIDIKPDHTDKESWFECTLASPCRILPRYCGNPNSDEASSTKPWAYRIIPFDPIDIPTQHSKRKLANDTTTAPVHKHTKLEIS